MTDVFASAERIAAHFLNTYYKNFVEENLTALAGMYDPKASVNFTFKCDDQEDNDTTFRKVGEPSEYHKFLLDTYGHRKVEITNVDFAPYNGCVTIACTGHIFRPLKTNVFYQSFVISPTKYRENTYHIDAEILRFLTDTAEPVPEGAKVVTQQEYDTIMEEYQNLLALDKQAEEEEEKRYQEEQKAIAAQAMKQRAPVTPETTEKPTAPAPRSMRTNYDGRRFPSREYRERQKSRDGVRKFTSSVLISNIPKGGKLRDINEAGKQFGEIKDSYWFNGDCVITYAKPEMARSAQQTKVKLYDKILPTGFFFLSEAPQNNQA